MREKTETHYSFCRICESLCGLKIKIENNRVVSISPDEEHVATNGFACPKGLKQNHLFDSPDRLKYPLKKIDGSWERISWKTALQEIGDKVAEIKSQFDPDAIGMYVGTAAGFGVLHPMFAQGFMTGIGSRSMFASATQDCSNKFAVAEHMYGFPFTQPFPDLENLHCLIIVGANPLVSKWSFLQVPNPSKQLKELEKRGAKIFVVDPRRTETAKVAGMHLFIRPNTDVFFYLSFLNEVIDQDGIDKDQVDKYGKGFEEIANLAKNWPASKTEQVTGISAKVLSDLVKTYLNSDGAALYSSTGVNMGSHGVLSFWIQECINFVTGNLDKKGGTLVSTGVIDFPRFGKKNGVLLRKDRSRVGDFPSVNDAYFGGILADEILTPGKKQIKALFVTGGNPLITMANSNRLRKAFDQLELLVSLDILPTETASVGTYMLPCTTPLERPDLPFIFPLMLGLQTKPYLQATQAILEPEYEQMDEASIYLALAKYAKSPLFGSKLAQWVFGLLSKKHPKTGLPKVKETLILNLLLKITHQKSFKRLLKFKHGILRPSHQANEFLKNRLLTEDKKVNLSPEPLIKRAETLHGLFEYELKNLHRLKLITKRAVTTHNSWTHNFSDFVRGPRKSNYVYMCDRDAARLSLENGDVVDVKSDTATVRVPLRIDNSLKEGVVALPHGWGHQASGQQIARKTSGVNVNVLAKDGPEGVDPVSGMVQLTGFFVDVRKSSGPQHPDSWSGLKEDEWPPPKIRTVKTEN